MDTARLVTCGPCRRVDHARCIGRERGCRCNRCPGRKREIMADARKRADTSGDTAMLRLSVCELLALLVQREARLTQIAKRPAKAAFCPFCGERIIQTGWGRPRLTCSDRCRMRKLRHDRKQAASAA